MSTGGRYYAYCVSSMDFCIQWTRRNHPLQLILNQYGLVTQYDDIDLGQQWKS